MKVLVVEDEAVIAMSIEDMLQDMGHEVVGPAGAVAAALKAIQEAGDIDLALLDLNLRGETSYPVAESLDARNVPFAFMSGYGQSGIDARYRDRPMLMKPIDEDMLVRFIKDWARNKR